VASAAVWAPLRRDNGPDLACRLPLALGLAADVMAEHLRRTPAAALLEVIAPAGGFLNLTISSAAAQLIIVDSLDSPGSRESRQKHRPGRCFSTDSIAQDGALPDAVKVVARHEMLERLTRLEHRMPPLADTPLPTDWWAVFPPERRPLARRLIMAIERKLSDGPAAASRLVAALDVAWRLPLLRAPLPELNAWRHIVAATSAAIKAGDMP
jgi:hypothetical protein